MLIAGREAAVGVEERAFGHDGGARCDRLLTRLGTSRLDNSREYEMRKPRVDLLVVEDFALRPVGTSSTLMDSDLRGAVGVGSACCGLNAL